MLYLFGRLALSDSYYFNDDFQADEHPENQAGYQGCPALDLDGRPLRTSLLSPPASGEGELIYITNNLKVS